MIRNERQYRITKAQIRKFESALSQEKEKGLEDDKVHPLLKNAYLDAIQSQLDDLREQLNDYEKLRSGEKEVYVLESFDDLPKYLIKARIASGLTQKELAERLGLKEQQIQRYEATEYKSANLSRLLQVIKALGIQLKQGISLPDEIPIDNLFKKLETVGLDYNFIFQRIIPYHLFSYFRKPRTKTVKSNIALHISSVIGRIFGWTTNDMFGSSPLNLNMAAAGMVNFKVPSRAEERRLNAYTLYAHYLTLLIIEAASMLPKLKVPSDPIHVREEILTSFGDITFENVLHYVWNLGIPVLPLNDPGAFHGACWRIGGRNVIVIKQQTGSKSRWLFDLLHELWHVGQEPDIDRISLIEADPASMQRLSSHEEEKANLFAGDVMLSGRAEELAQLCVTEAKGKVELLKAAVPNVAYRNQVPTDSLANYMAFRLSLQRINWWGTAANLQTYDISPWSIARDILLRRLNFNMLNEIDQNLIMQALSDKWAPE